MHANIQQWCQQEAEKPQETFLCSPFCIYSFPSGFCYLERDFSGYFLTSAIETAIFNGPSERPRGTLMDSDTLSSPSMCAVSECCECAAVEQDERAPGQHSSITDAPLALSDLWV